MSLKWRSAAVIFTVSLAVRLAAAPWAPSQAGENHDFGSWVTLGRNLAQGQGFVESGQPTTVRPPIYPLFLSVFYRFSDNAERLAVWTQILLSSAGAVLIFFLGMKVFDPKVSFWAGVLAGLLPSGVIYSHFIASETLFTFLMILSLYAFVSASQRGSGAVYGLSGIFLGLSNLCRPVLSFLPFFLIPAAWIFNRSRREMWGLLLAAAMTYLVISPWTVRNHKIFGGFFLVSVGAGQAFWLGSIQETGGRYVSSDYPGYRQFDYLMTVNDPVTWEKVNFQAGLKNILANPPGYIRLTARKFVRQWFEPVGGQTIRRKSEIIFYFLAFFHAAFILLAAAGVFMSWPERGKLNPLYALLLCYGTTHLVIFPMARFRMPFEPVLGLFAVYAIFKIFGASPNQKESSGNPIRLGS